MLARILVISLSLLPEGIGTQSVSITQETSWGGVDPHAPPVVLPGFPDSPGEATRRTEDRDTAEAKGMTESDHRLGVVQLAPAARSQIASGGPPPAGPH